jgi:predicted RecA/RadA family phage recombinase
MINYVEQGNSIDYPNASGSTIAAGTVVSLTNMVCVAHEDIADQTTGVLLTCGVFAIPKVAGAITQGQKVYATPAGSITTTATGNIFAGHAWKAAASADATVNVRLGAI